MSMDCSRISAELRSPITVLQVLPALQSGGVERGVLEIADALVKAGHRSLVVSRGGAMVETLLAQGSEHFQCPIGQKSPLTLRFVPWLRKLLRREAVDVVDYHSRLPGWIALAAIRALPPAQRPACISSLHGLHSVNRYSSVMCRGDRIVVVSDTVRRYALENYSNADPSRIEVIFRGLDDQEYPRGYHASEAWKERFFAEFPQARNRLKVAIVGRLTRLKGHHDFVKLIQQLRQRGLDAHGLIIGGAQRGKEAYKRELERFIADSELGESISMVGPRRDLKEIYATCDLVTSLSSTPESFGRTVAESLAIGTPVVGYAHGGVQEILEAEFPCGAVPPGNLLQLTDRCGEILTLQKKPDIVINQFSLQRMQQETLALYSQAARPPLGNAIRAAA